MEISLSPHSQCKLTSVYDGDTFQSICKKLEINSNVSGWVDNFGKKINDYILDNNIKKIRVLSLFSGAGGLDIGFLESGYEIVESVELEEKFCKTLIANSIDDKKYEHTSVKCIDIRNYYPKLSNIDFIIGGPPCQTFSAAGRRANGVLGITDSRGTLFEEYVRILKDLLPRGFLFENVYGIIGAQGGKPWEEIKKQFSEIGYNLFYRVLDSADYGVPQHRERLIIVGLREGAFKFPRPLFGPDSLDNENYYSADNAINDLSENIEEKPIVGRYSSLLKEIPPGLNYSYYTEEMGHPNPVFAWRSKFSDFLYKADPAVPVRTIKAQGGQWTGPLHWNNRHFSIAEYKRLQTFPDNYEIVGSKQNIIHQIGNSVPPQLSRILAISIANQIFGIKYPINLSYLSSEEKLGFRQRKREMTEIYKDKAVNSSKHVSCEIVQNVITEYNVCIDNSFRLIESKDSEYHIISEWNDSLNVIISNKNEVTDKVYCIIHIEPRTEWNLGIKEINAVIKTNVNSAYVLAWKMIEKEIHDRGYREDMVQLNGYYQYIPKIICKLEYKKEFKLQYLNNIVNGEITRRIITNNELAVALGISNNDVISIAEEMKTLGYEIRNHNTNSQIEEGMWLIPYPFPTLTPLSIQLRKKLR